MGNKKYSELELIEFAEHLHYEIWMLFQITYVLALGFLGKGPAHNAILESFAMHSRNLIDFLYANKPAVKKDIVAAEHYFESFRDWKSIRPPRSELLKQVKIRADKQIAHMTITRLRKENWDFLKIASDINETLKIFINSVPKKLLGTYTNPIADEIERMYLISKT